MAESPFAFFRGAAAVMANDLASTTDHRDPGAGLRRRARHQLREVRDAGAQPHLRHQRLRRDAARARGSGTSSASCASLHIVARQRGFAPSAVDRLVMTASRGVPASASRRTRPCSRSRSGRNAPRSRTSSRTFPRSTAHSCGATCAGRAGRTTSGRSRSSRSRWRAVSDSSRIHRCSLRLENTDIDIGDVIGVVEGYRRVAQRRLPRPVRPFRGRRRRPQGRRRRQRRHVVLDRAARRPGPSRRRPPDLPGEGGAAIRARAVRGRVEVRARGATRRRRPAPHAGGERSVPRMGAGAELGAPVLHPPALGREGLGRPDAHGLPAPQLLRRALCRDARPRARSHGRRSADRRVHRDVGHVRAGDRVVRGRVRAGQRAGSRHAAGSDRGRTPGRRAPTDPPPPTMGR